MVVAGELAEVGEAVAKKGGVEPPGDDPLLEQYLDGSSFLHKKSVGHCCLSRRTGLWTASRVGSDERLTLCYGVARGADG